MPGWSLGGIGALIYMEGRILVKWQGNNLHLLNASDSNAFNFFCSQATFVNLVKQTCLTKTDFMSLNDFTSNSLT